MEVELDDPKFKHRCRSIETREADLIRGFAGKGGVGVGVILIPVPIKVQAIQSFK